MTTEQIAKLNKPLPKEAVATRTQANQTLSYIEGHYAIRVANDIFGHDGWDRNTDQLNLVQAEQKGDGRDQKWYVGYTCVSTVRVKETTRMGVGFGQGIDRDLGRAHESAIKEAETDAMKRALMTFGDPLGLALYDKKQEHVEQTPKQEPKKQAPAPAKPNPDLEKVGAFIKGIGMTKDDFAAFKDQHKNWSALLFNAESEGVSSVEELRLYVAGVNK